MSIDYSDMLSRSRERRKNSDSRFKHDIPRIPRYIDSRLYIRRCQRQVLGIRINYEYYNFTEVN